MPHQSVKHQCNRLASWRVRKLSVVNENGPNVSAAACKGAAHAHSSPDGLACSHG